MSETKKFSIILVSITAMLFSRSIQQFTPNRRNMFSDYEAREIRINTCDPFKETDLRFNRFQLLEEEQKLKQEFRFGSSLMSDYVQTGEMEVFDEISRSAKIFMIPHFVILIITIACFFGMVSYLIARAVKRGIRKMEKRKRKKGIKKSKRRNRQYSNSFLTLANTKRCRGINFCCNIIFTVAIIIVGSGWRLVALEAVSDLERSDCTLGRLYSYAQYGVDGYVASPIDGSLIESRYIGVRGELHFWAKVKSEIRGVEKYDISERRFTQTLALLNQNIDGLISQFESSMVTSPRKLENQATPEIVNKLSSLKKGAINLQMEYLKFIGSRFEEITTVTQNIENDPDKFKRSVEDLENTLINAINGLNDLSKITRKYNYYPRGPWMVFYIETTFWVFSIGTVLSAVFYCLSYKVQKAIKFSVCCQSTLTVFTMAFSIMLEILAITAYTHSAIYVNACSEATAFINDKNISLNLIPNRASHIAESCIFSNATGRLSSSQGNDNRVQTDQILAVIRNSRFRFDMINQQQSTDNFLVRKMEEFRTEVENLKNYQDSSLVFESNNLDPMLIIKEINDLITSTGNEIQLTADRCTKAPVSQSTDPVDFRADQDYCIVPSIFPHIDITGRYSGSLSTGQSVELKYSALASFMKQHDQLADNILNEFTSNVQPVVSRVVSDLAEDTKSFSEEMMQVAPNSIQFFLESNYDQVSDCRQLKDYLVDTVGTVCVGFIDSFDTQGSILLWFAPLMAIFSCINCIGVIGSRTKLIEADMYGSGAVFNQTDKEPTRDIGPEAAPIGLGNRRGRKRDELGFSENMSSSKNRFINSGVYSFADSRQSEAFSGYSEFDGESHRVGSKASFGNGVIKEATMVDKTKEKKKSEKVKRFQEL